MATVEEYLRTSYSPDCDYVDGEVQERNLGQTDHSWIQGILIAYLFSRRKEWGITVLPEQRVRVSKTRFRIPDVCVVLGPKPAEQVLTVPPFLCIEILSPEDRMSPVQERIRDYLNMGVAYVWVLDPETKRAYSFSSPEGLREEKGGVLRTENPAMEVPLNEIFEA